MSINNIEGDQRPEEGFVQPKKEATVSRETFIKGILGAAVVGLAGGYYGNEYYRNVRGRQNAGAPSGTDEGTAQAAADLTPTPKEEQLTPKATGLPKSVGVAMAEVSVTPIATGTPKAEAVQQATATQTRVPETNTNTSTPLPTRTATATETPTAEPTKVVKPEAGKDKKGLPFEKGKYQTFPRLEIKIDGERKRVFQQIDLGTLGPDVDTIFGFDFEGDIPTGALEISRAKGEILETRVVGIKRVDLETVQFSDVIGGDRFDLHRMSDFGGNSALDDMARSHAKNTARKHQKVIYIGDLGLFQKQWGKQEQGLLSRIIRAQRPARLDLGIPEPNFVNPREF